VAPIDAPKRHPMSENLNRGLDSRKTLEFQMVRRISLQMYHI
jgi:hypothetical protein